MNTPLNLLSNVAALVQSQERLHELGVPRDTETDWETFKDDISGRSEKTIFSGQHRPERPKNPNSRHGYEISIPPPHLRGPLTVACSPAFLKKTKDFSAMRWSSAIICGYDPKRDNIMFEVSSTERGYSCHTMKMSKLERLISEDKITIKKII